MPARPGPRKHTSKKKRTTWAEQRQLHIEYAYGPELEEQMRRVTAGVHFTGPRPEFEDET